MNKFFEEHELTLITIMEDPKEKVQQQPELYLNTRLKLHTRENKLVVAASTDLSAAHDTVNHKIPEILSS